MQSVDPDTKDLDRAAAAATEQKVNTDSTDPTLRIQVTSDGQLCLSIANLL
jgi:hypothetical protein